jgi:hypothetical protein
MVFVANDGSGALLHAVADVAGDRSNWQRLNNLNQSTKQVPALVSVFDVLRVVFVANNETNSLLVCDYIDANDAWSPNVSLGESSKSAPALLAGPPEPFPSFQRIFMYFVANNETNDLLFRTIP